MKKNLHQKFAKIFQKWRKKFTEKMKLFFKKLEKFTKKFCAKFLKIKKITEKFLKNKNLKLKNWREKNWQKNNFGKKFLEFWCTKKVKKILKFAEKLQKFYFKKMENLQKK